MNDHLTLQQKSAGHWTEIFSALTNNQRFIVALANKGKHVPSPLNIESQKNGFRLDADYENKNGLGYDNLFGTMSGVEIIAKLTNSTINQAAHKIHNFIDNNKITKQTPTQLAAKKIEVDKSKQAEQQKIVNAKKQVKSILAQTKNNKHLKAYLKSRGLNKAFDNLNPSIYSVDNLYYNKQTSTPGIVAPVFNARGETVFLHRTYLNQKSEKNTALENNKKVTPKIIDTAYQNAFGIKVNNANTNNSDIINIVEGIETGLAVSLITDNREPVISTINTVGMTKFMPSNKDKHIVIWADNDAAGIKAANSLKRTLDKISVSATIKIPKTKGHDFLDSYTTNHTQKASAAQALAQRRAKQNSQQIER